MNLIENLCNDLSISSVFICEDEFAVINEFPLFLEKILLLDTKKLESINKYIESTKQNKYSEVLLNLRSINEEKKDLIGFIKSTNLDKIKEIIKVELFNELERIFENKSFMNDIVLWGCYDEKGKRDDFYSCILSFQKVPIYFWNKGSDKLDEFKKLYSFIHPSTESLFHLFVIDKSLGSGVASDKEGLELLKALQTSYPNKFLSFIYTSNGVENPVNSSEKFDDFFFREVKKTDSSDIQKEISKVLTLALLAQTVKLHIDKLNNSIGFAEKLTYKNIIKISEIIKQAKLEGMLTHERINFWLKNAIEYYFHDTVDSFHKPLIEYLDKTEIEIDGNGITSEEFQSVDKYEIYDTFVNRKFSPISSGDIFRIEKKYYILLEQSCDIAFRATENKRKRKIATLYLLDKCDCYNEKKFEALSKTELHLKNFTTPEIFIHLKFNKEKQIDFRILDLCIFNKDGEAKTTLVPEEDTRQFEHYLFEYREIIKKQIEKIKEVRVLSEKIESIFSDMVDYSLCNYSENSGSITYKIKRICRMKEPFLANAYNLLINYKNRASINTIEKIGVNQKKINITLPDHEKIIGNIKTFSVGSAVFMQKKDLYNIITGNDNENIKQKINSISNVIKIPSSTEHHDVKSDNSEILFNIKELRIDE